MTVTLELSSILLNQLKHTISMSHEMVYAIVCILIKIPLYHRSCSISVLYYVSHTHMHVCTYMHLIPAKTKRTHARILSLSLSLSRTNLCFHVLSSFKTSFDSFVNVRYLRYSDTHQCDVHQFYFVAFCFHFITL